jgi:uncharacterized protein (DUF433 family)
MDGLMIKHSFSVSIGMTIVKDPGIKGGKPTVKGTRVTAEAVLESFYKLDRSVEQVAEDYGIEKEEVEEVLRKQYRDQERIKA